MNTARAICGESYNAGAGEVFRDDAPFVVPYINSSLQDLQDRLENNAFVTLTVDNFYLLNIPAISLDPSAQIFIDIGGLYISKSTGVTLITSAVTLPPDMMVPEVVRERLNGSNYPFVPMIQPQGGLVSRAQGPFLSTWEWRASGNVGMGDALWFNGATQARDISLRYKKRGANVAVGTDFTTINVPLPGAGNALAYQIAYRYVASRNPETAPQVLARADFYIREIIKRITRQKQGISYRRPPYGGSSTQGMNRNRIF